jgi:hypothetical protein
LRPNLVFLFRPSPPTLPNNFSQNTVPVPNHKALVKAMPVPAVRTSRFAPPLPKAPTPIFLSSPPVSPLSSTRSSSSAERVVLASLPSQPC